MKLLNRSLPKGEYRAFAEARLGEMAAADIAEYESEFVAPSLSDDGSVATMKSTALYTLEAQFPDEFEVQIIEYREGMRLSAVVEFVSPGNKDRESHRQRFANKCIVYLEKGVGVVVVDVVTNRHANLHNEILLALECPNAPKLAESGLYVVAYKPDIWNTTTIDVWPHVAMVGQPIPSVPLPLRSGLNYLLDLESTYAIAIDEHGLFDKG